MESNRKRRVLFTGEASFLATGFSNYWNEVIKRLYSTGEIEVAEMGSYAHADDPRCQQVPWKFYPVAPARSDKVAMQKYSSNPTNQFGEGIFDEVCLDFKPDIVCVPPGTLIQTPSGVQNIQNIQIGDRVISHTGEARRVIKTFKKQHIGNMIKIKIATDYREHTFTENHPILVVKNVRRHSRGRKVSERHFVKNAMFIPSKDISIGDYVLIPKNMSTVEYDNIKISNFLHQFILSNNDHLISACGRSNVKSINNDIKIDYNLSRLFGYYCAEGHIDRHGVHFTFGRSNNEQKFVNDVIKLLKDIFDIDSKIIKDGNRLRISTQCVILGSFFKKIAGNGAIDKHIPSFIFNNIDYNIIRGFIRGLIRGDGCYNGFSITYSTVSRQMANQMRTLLLRLNIKNSIYKNPQRTYIRKSDGQTRNNSEIFIICIDSKYAQLLHCIVEKDILLPHKSIIYESDGEGWFENNYFIARVKNIHKKCPYKGQVYNLEVENDNSYVTGFSVHNCGIRDHWMDEFIERSSLRNNFSWIEQPTIDGEPQKLVWLDSYRRADAILTYSQYGMNLLKRTGRRGTKLITIASPGVDLELFKPPENKRDHKAKLGIDPNSLIIGTVMRNQKRKLYYDLIEAFSIWLHKEKTKGHLDIAKRTFLYLHTSYPDVGYDIGKAIRDFKIGNKVIMTYLCGNCQTAYPSFFAGEITICRKCGKLAAHPPNANHSCPRNVLADIMKTFDLYVQYSIAEGFGMPCVDAIACGVPVAAVDYSAMQDHLRCPTSIPIRVERFFWESIIETEQRRALPDNIEFASQLGRFLKQSESKRLEQSKLTRKYAEELVDTYGQDQKMPRYSWDRTAAIWGQVIRETEIYDPTTTWLCPTSRVNHPILVPPNDSMNNSEFVNWVIGKVWNRPDMLQTHFSGEWLKSLNSCYRTVGDKRIPFNRKALVDHFMAMIQQGNLAEEKRLSMINRADPDQISVMVI